MMAQLSIFQPVGGLSKPSKMPGYGTSLPADMCLTGKRLRTVKGSVCASCYACKGNYQFPNVQGALTIRAALLGSPTWAADMTAAIAATGQDVFRWHDSGDLQGVWHLEQIVEVCEATPEVSHWLPTKERGILRKFVRNGGSVPLNLCIRLSAHMVGETTDAPDGMQTSSVSTDSGFPCPATRGAKSCDAAQCRACWDSNVANIDYRAH